jgi:hypothetical protein
MKNKKERRIEKKEEICVCNHTIPNKAKQKEDFSKKKEEEVNKKFHLFFS